MSHMFVRSAVMGSGVKALCITVWRAGIVVAVLFGYSTEHIKCCKFSVVLND